MQNYEKLSEMQKESLLFFSFPRRSNFGRKSQNYEKLSEKQKKYFIICGLFKEYAYLWILNRKNTRISVKVRKAHGAITNDKS